MEKEKPITLEQETESSETTAQHSFESASHSQKEKLASSLVRIEELKKELKENTKTTDLRPNTNILEARLEGDVEKEKQPKDRKSTKFTALLMAAAAFISPLGDRESPGATAKKENKALITQELGYDIEARAAQYGYKVSFDIKNHRGKYLLHIGQTHETFDLQLNKVSWSQKQITSQKNIEKILLSLPHTSVLTVFTEGFSYNERDSADIESAKDLNELIALIKETDITQEKAEKILGTLETALQTLNLYQKDKTIFDHYLVAGAIIQLVESLELKTPKEFIKENTRLRAIKTQLNTLQQISGLTPEDMPYIAGAVEKLYTEGKIHRKGSESFLANQRGIEALAKYRKAESLKKQARSESEIREAEKILAEAKNLFEKYTKKEREATAIEIIQQEISTSKEKIIPLVYGKAHNFKSQIEIKNTEHPEHRLGLITLEPLN